MRIFCRGLAVTALLLGGLTALTTATSTTATARVIAAAPAVSSARCAPVWFIGARGSGETSATNYGYTGLGAPVSYMAKVVAGDLAAKGLYMAAMPVDYPAASVDVLKPNKAVLALIALGAFETAAVEWTHASLDNYDSSMNLGIKRAEAAVATVLSECPDAKIIMAGYSQGSVAVHDAEVYLAEHKPAELAHIAGTLLLADPDRVPNTKAKDFGTAPAKGEGVRTYLCALKYICVVTPHDVPLPSTTASIVNSGDLVADFKITDLADFSAHAKVHTAYPKTGLSLLESAATWVAGKVPGLSFSDAAIRLGPLSHGPLPSGQTTSEQLTASGGAAPYSFHVLSLDYPKRVPAWVSLSSAGKLTISPPAGTKQSVSFRVYAKDNTGRLSKLATVSFTVAPVATPWTAARLTFPASDPTLWDVSCPTAAFCGVGGGYFDSEGFLLTKTGNSWSQDVAPLPADAINQDSSVQGISCPSPSSCVGVGSYWSTSDTSEGLLETWSGTGWTPVQAPDPAAGEALNGVSCPSPSFCVAVGDYFDSTSNEALGVAVTLANGAWTAAETPLPANVTSYKSVRLAGVSCRSASFCVAAGDYVDTSGWSHPLLLTYSGGSWAAAAVPATLAGYGELEGVSCPSASFCVAVGDLASQDGGLIVTLSGGSWKVATSTVPADVYASAPIPLAAVSCVSSSSCTAAGNDGSAAALLYTLAGGSWTAAKAPVPAGANGNPNTSVFGVSCVADATCTAVGDYVDSVGQSAALLLTSAG